MLRAEHPQVGVLDGGVAQALAERERGALREVGVADAVLAADHVVVGRLLARVARERDREPALGLDQPEHELGDGLAAAHPGVGRPDDRRRRVRRRRQDERLRRDDDHDHGGAGGDEGVEQRDLAADELERRGRAPLAHELDAVAHHGDGEVGVARGGDGLGDQRVVGRRRDDDLRPRLPVGEQLALRVGREREDVGAARVGHGPALRGERAEAVEHGRRHLARVAVRQPVGLARRARPVAELRVVVVRVRADDGDRPGGRPGRGEGPAVGRAGGTVEPAREREGAVVGEEHEGAARDLEVHRGVLGRRDDRLLARDVRPPRVLEQAEAELEREDAPDGGVDRRLLDEAAVHRLERALEEARRRHDHVVAGAHGRGGRVHVVGLDVLLPDHAAHVVPVGDERAGVAPLAAQDVVEQPAVHGDGHAVHGLVAEHERGAALARDPLERGQEPGPELALRDVGLARVAPALRLGVAREVLRRGEDARRVGQPVALVAADHRGRELADEERVLAERLVDAAPAQVARDAEHGGEGPVDAGRGDLDRGRARDLLHERGVPRRGHAELRGEDRRADPERVAVDAVLGEQQGDAQPRPPGELVRGEDVLRRGVQQRARVLLEHRGADAVARVELEHLADLLGQRHAGEEVLDAVGHGHGGVEVGQGAHGRSFHGGGDGARRRRGCGHGVGGPGAATLPETK